MLPKDQIKFFFSDGQYVITKLLTGYNANEYISYVHNENKFEKCSSWRRKSWYVGDDKLFIINFFFISVYSIQNQQGKLCQNDYKSRTSSLCSIYSEKALILGKKGSVLFGSLVQLNVLVPIISFLSWKPLVYAFLLIISQMLTNTLYSWYYTPRNPLIHHI